LTHNRTRPAYIAAMLRKIGLVAGPTLFLLIWLWPTNGETTAQRTLAVAALMLTWWVTEAVAIAVTSLLPVLLFPILGICTPDVAAAPYAKDYVFLFLGGFIIALALEKHSLHRYIAFKILSRSGSGPRGIILGIMLATAFLSMWISNTATAVMMLPIATTAGAIYSENAPNPKNFNIAILLGVAYGASIGGIATLIGTPPNMVMAGILDSKYGSTVTFGEWLLIGGPFSIIMFVLVYLLLTRVLFKIPATGKEDNAELIAQNKTTRLTNVQKRVLWVFVFTCLGWALKDLIHLAVGVEFLSDPVIGIGGGIAMFIIPEARFGGNGLLEWADTVKLPWGIILLFGGGLSLAAALDRAGVMETIGVQFSGISKEQTMLLMLALTTVSLFLTEVMSNVALVTVFVPVVAGIGVNAGLAPETLSIPVTLAASCAFMLPMATPPNAIVFSTGELTMLQMAKSGFVLNIVAVLVIWVMWHFQFFSAPGL